MRLSTSEMGLRVRENTSVSSMDDFEQQTSPLTPATSISPETVANPSLKLTNTNPTNLLDCLDWNPEEVRVLKDASELASRSRSSSIQSSVASNLKSPRFIRRSNEPQPISLPAYHFPSLQKKPTHSRSKSHVPVGSKSMVLQPPLEHAPRPMKSNSLAHIENGLIKNVEKGEVHKHDLINRYSIYVGPDDFEDISKKTAILKKLKNESKHKNSNSISHFGFLRKTMVHKQTKSASNIE